jgi:hypothetical protein
MLKKSSSEDESFVYAAASFSSPEAGPRFPTTRDGCDDEEVVQEEDDEGMRMEDDKKDVLCFSLCVFLGPPSRFLFIDRGGGTASRADPIKLLIVNSQMMRLR